MSKLKLEVGCDKRLEFEVRSILSYIIMTRDTVSGLAEKVGISKMSLHRLLDGRDMSYRQQSMVAHKVINQLGLTSEDIAKLNNGLDKLQELSAHIIGGEANGS